MAFCEKWHQWGGEEGWGGEGFGEDGACQKAKEQYISFHYRKRWQVD